VPQPFRFFTVHVRPRNPLSLFRVSSKRGWQRERERKSRTVIMAYLQHERLLILWQKVKTMILVSISRMRARARISPKNERRRAIDRTRRCGKLHLACEHGLFVVYSRQSVSELVPTISRKHIEDTECVNHFRAFNRVLTRRVNS